MDRAEYERLLSVAATYRKHLLAAADSNFSLGQFAFAKRQYLALIEPELELGAAEAKYCRQRLLLPELAASGLTVRSMRGDGRSEWTWDDDDDLSDAGAEEMPLAGVQSDARSVCPLVRSHAELIECALTAAAVGPDDLVADLGCGDGRLLLKAARRGARAVGFDVNPYCIRRARSAAHAAGLHALIDVVDHDLFQLSDHPLFGAATVVYVYLVPKLVKRLEPLLTRAVENGKRVLIFCTTGGSSEPGNAIGGLAPTRILMRGMLRLYGPSL
jgi:hypothetical protein